MLGLIKFIILISLGSSVVLSAFIYVQYFYPDVANKFLVDFDKYGLTEVGRQEQERIKQINALGIPYEHKTALRNRTIFMEASPKMVYLALGEPQTVTKGTYNYEGNEVDMIEMVYYFKDDRRPTILVFRQNRLVEAKKSSTLDVN